VKNIGLDRIVVHDIVVGHHTRARKGCHGKVLISGGETGLVVTLCESSICVRVLCSIDSSTNAHTPGCGEY